MVGGFVTGFEEADDIIAASGGGKDGCHIRFAQRCIAYFAVEGANHLHLLLIGSHRGWHSDSLLQIKERQMHQHTTVGQACARGQQIGGGIHGDALGKKPLCGTRIHLIVLQLQVGISCNARQGVMGGIFGYCAFGLQFQYALGRLSRTGTLPLHIMPLGLCGHRLCPLHLSGYMVYACRHAQTAQGCHKKDVAAVLVRNAIAVNTQRAHTKMLGVLIFVDKNAVAGPLHQLFHLIAGKSLLQGFTPRSEHLIGNAQSGHIGHKGCRKVTGCERMGVMVFKHFGRYIAVILTHERTQNSGGPVIGMCFKE